MAARRRGRLSLRPLARLGPAGALAVLVLAAYASSLDAGFVLDNRLLILEDPRVHAATLENLRLIFTQDYWWPRAVGGLYRPITTLSFLANYAVLGNADRPLGYHWVNLALHWLVAVLVYVLVRRLVARAWTAFVAAALFAVHPITTESVANIVGRADVLAAAAVVGGSILHATAGATHGWRRVACLGALALVAALGVLAKESAAVLPGVMLLYDLARPSGWRRRLAGYAAVGAPLVAIWIARERLYATLAPTLSPFVDNPLVRADFWPGRLTAIKVLGRYLWRLLWPLTLSPDYSYDQIPIVRWPFRGWEDWQTVLALAAIATLAAAAIGLRRRSPAAFFFIGLFGVAVLPVSNLLVPIGTIMAERLMYLPAVGFVGCVALGADALARRLRSRRLVAAVLALLAAAYGVRTALRNRDWHDDVRLWAEAVRTSPTSFRTHAMLARALSQAEQAPYPSIDRIIAEGEKALAIVDGLPSRDEPSLLLLEVSTYYRLKGDLLGGRGATESTAWYTKAADLLAAAVLLDRAGNDENRAREIARGRRRETIVDIGNYEIYQQRGEMLLLLDRPRDAIVPLEYMRHLAPNQADAHVLLARATLATGAPERAAVSLLRALALDPHRADALALLPDVYRRIDGGACALVSERAVTRLDPACPTARSHLCAAWGGLVALYRDARQDVLAAPFHDHAVRAWGCAPEAFLAVDR